MYQSVKVQKLTNSNQQRDVVGCKAGAANKKFKRTRVEGTSSCNKKKSGR
jgi:hypothetical protein